MGRGKSSAPRQRATSALPPGPVDPAPEHPPVRLDSDLELRIHGVSGTSTEDMLQHPHPVQVSGDGLAGFYRRSDHLGPVDGGPGERQIEAYRWGGLTSASAARAFWLLLLPFALVNVASWAHPVRPRSRFAPVGLMSGLIRVFGLLLTLSVVLTTVVVSLDLVAWQCANAPATCGSRHFFTRFMVADADAVWARSGARIALGALVPVVVVVGLARLAQSTSRRYEEYGREASGEPPTEPEALPHLDDFAKPRFWAGGRPFHRLRSLHLGAALAGIAAVVAYAAGTGATGGARRASDAVVVASSAVVLLALGALAHPVTGRRKELLDEEPVAQPVHAALMAAQWIGLALAAVALLIALRSDPPTTSTSLPGLSWAISAVYVAQLACLGAYLLATLWARAASPTTGEQALVGRMLFRSLAPVALANIGMAVASAYGAGLVFRLADFLGRPVPEASPSPKVLRLSIHRAYYESARVTTIVVAVTGALVVAAWLWTRGKSRRCYEVAVREYAGDLGPDVSPEERERVRAIARMQAWAGLTDRADALIGSLVVGTIVGKLALLVWNPWNLRSTMTTAGTWLIGLVAAGFVLAGRGAYSSSRTRRTVGILWDVGTFWPRAAHPFAPPCYCERVIPELTRRVARLAAEGRVVISAHSQGSAIAVAALHRLDARSLQRVALLTYGSPVDRLFARVFPHFFGRSSRAIVEDSIERRWRNLYRRTDPIGGPVHALDVEMFTCQPTAAAEDPIDDRLKDPLFHVEPGAFVAPRSRGHSDYFHDSRFAANLDALFASIPR